MPSYICPATIHSKRHPLIPFVPKRQIRPAYSPNGSIPIKTTQLLPRILYILLRFHPHVEDRAILTAANNFTMHTSLAPLALRP
jgi:hypothetical protein